MTEMRKRALDEDASTPVQEDELQCLKRVAMEEDIDNLYEEIESEDEEEHTLLQHQEQYDSQYNNQVAMEEDVHNSYEEDEKQNETPCPNQDNMERERSNCQDDATLHDLEEDDSNCQKRVAMRREGNLDEQESESLCRKRVNLEEEGKHLHDIEDVMVMKLLCPGSLVGAIIGRGGSVLNMLKSSTNTNIKISQNNDYFPETTDRVIAVTGQPNAVTKGFGAVIDKIFEVTLSNDAKRLDNAVQMVDENVQPISIRILIPHAASGVVIGRGGSNIKEISNLTDTRLQLSDASDPFQTFERIVSITGSEASNVRNAAVSVLELLLENRNVGNFINTSPSYSIATSLHGQAGRHPWGQHSVPSLRTIRSTGLPSHHTSHAYGQGHTYNHSQHIGYSNTYSSSYLAYPSGGFCPPPSTTVISQMAVPDHMVGVVVGKGGSVLKRIMSNTGAHIKVSQKGEYLAGTNNRSVTIEGTQQQVHNAQDAISSLLGGFH